MRRSVFYKYAAPRGVGALDRKVIRSTRGSGVPHAAEAQWRSFQKQVFNLIGPPPRRAPPRARAPRRSKHGDSIQIEYDGIKCIHHSSSKSSVRNSQNWPQLLTSVSYFSVGY